MMAWMLDLVISSDLHVMEPFDLSERALGGCFEDKVPRLVKSYAGIDGNFFFLRAGNGPRR